MSPMLALRLAMQAPEIEYCAAGIVTRSSFNLWTEISARHSHEFSLGSTEFRTIDFYSAQFTNGHGRALTVRD